MRSVLISSVRSRPPSGAGVVAGALGGDAEAGLAGEADEGDDVIGVGGDRDVVGALVDGEVPGRPRRVPALVGGREELAGELGADEVGVDQGAGLEHGVSPLVLAVVDEALRSAALRSSRGLAEDELGVVVAVGGRAHLPGEAGRAAAGLDPDPVRRARRQGQGAAGAELAGLAVDADRQPALEDLEADLVGVEARSSTPGAPGPQTASSSVSRPPDSSRVASTTR